MIFIVLVILVIIIIFIILTIKKGKENITSINDKQEPQIQDKHHDNLSFDDHKNMMEEAIENVDIEANYIKSMIRQKYENNIITHKN